MTKAINNIVFGVFALLAIGVGLYPIMYFLMDANYGIENSKSAALLQDVLWNIGFYGHIVFGGIALLVGWIQFSKTIRNRYLNWHRKVGMVYVFAVLIGGICGVFIGFFATGGVGPTIGFVTLGLIWLSTTLGGFWAIRQGDILLHQRLMTYSYAACFGAVTLRIWLPLLVMYHQGDFIPAYRIVAWLSWVPNLIVAFFIDQRLLRKNR